VWFRRDLAVPSPGTSRYIFRFLRARTTTYIFLPFAAIFSCSNQYEESSQAPPVLRFRSTMYVYVPADLGTRSYIDDPSSQTRSRAVPEPSTNTYIFPPACRRQRVANPRHFYVCARPCSAFGAAQPAQRPTYFGVHLAPTFSVRTRIYIFRLATRTLLREGPDPRYLLANRPQRSRARRLVLEAGDSSSELGLIYVCSRIRQKAIRVRSQNVGPCARSVLGFGRPQNWNNYLLNEHNQLHHALHNGIQNRHKNCRFRHNDLHRARASPCFFSGALSLLACFFACLPVRIARRNPNPDL